MREDPRRLSRRPSPKDPQEADQVILCKQDPISTPKTPSGGCVRAKVIIRRFQENRGNSEASVVSFFRDQEKFPGFRRKRDRFVADSLLNNGNRVSEKRYESFSLRKFGFCPHETELRIVAMKL